MELKPIEYYLKNLPFWDKLSKEEKESVTLNSSIVKYDKNEFIHSCNGECLGLIYVVSGQVRVSMFSEEGREITLFRIFENDMCILAASCVISQITFDVAMSAEEETHVLIVNSRTILELIKHNIYAECCFYQLATEKFSEVMWSMQQLLFMGFDKRLAIFLYEEYNRTKKASIEMTHEQIAKNIGSAREVVSRMLKRFSQDCIVELKRGSIEIKNAASLKKLAIS